MSRLIRGFYALVHWALHHPATRWVVPRRFRRADIVISPGVGAVESGVFFEPSDAIVSRSQILGEPPITPEPERFPAVTWGVFNDAWVTNNRYFPFLVTGQTIMLPPRRVEGPWRLSYRRNRIVWSDGEHVVIDTARGEQMAVDQAIFLGGRDFTNWYHWLVDALPQLHLANRLPEHLRGLPVVIPEQIYRYPTMVEALELFLDGRDVIRVPEWSAVRATRLVWIDPLEVSNLPQRKSHPTMDPKIHQLHREGMESYRDVFLGAFAASPVTPHRKIVLARDTTRRSFNQDEVLAVAAEFGFEPCYPEKLSLAEQVAVFREARHIIGPSGAGFAGLLFVQPGTQALCWQDTRIRSMTILPDLATLNHADYYHVFYRSDESGGLFKSNYHLDPDWLRDSLRTFLG